MARLQMEGKNITADQIKGMVTRRDCKSLPSEMVECLRYRERARDWHYKMKSRLYVGRHLQTEYYAKNEEELSDYLARQIYDNAMNYYYADRTIRKDSWRNML